MVPMLRRLHQVAPSRAASPIAVIRSRKAEPIPWARYAHFEPLPRADDGTRRRAWLLALFVVSFFFFSELLRF